LIGISTGFLYLHETLESRRSLPDYGIILGKKLKSFFSIKENKRRFVSRFQPDETTSLLRPESSHSNSSRVSSSDFSESVSKPALPPPRLREVFTKQSTINLISYTMLAMHGGSFDQLIAVFMHHPREAHNPNDPWLKFAGGFGTDSSRIGTLFTL
jgi:hypothetical protein